ncbi:MAG: AbrB/MazE/SpoVT family DNA-binding domain-containing protein [Dehalococcoidia bacterium]|nr:AbrB/MazE/SpoVT family DNA-binding domain-containing protein [Dehalococcoidia bacterium]MYD29561.1 AbrB/MazE/SpoVT family DNA-binding domain-containing protein [Dehalococcoidia bacterium]
MELRRTRVGSRGRVTIPVEFRNALGLTEGDPVVLELDEGVLNIHARKVAIKKAQDLVAKHTEGKRSLVDELVAERRENATRG